MLAAQPDPYEKQSNRFPTKLRPKLTIRERRHAYKGHVNVVACEEMDMSGAKCQSKIATVRKQMKHVAYSQYRLDASRVKIIMINKYILGADRSSGLNMTFVQSIVFFSTEFASIHGIAQQP